MHVLLIDRDGAAREALGAAIRGSIMGVRLEVACTLEDALSRAAANPPFELAILHAWARCHVQSALRRLHDAFPGLPVLVLSADDPDEKVIGAIRAGAAGYATRALEGAALASVVRFVAEGGTYVPPRVIRNVVLAAREADGHRLSERQVEVLRLVARGFNNKEIARELAITEGTVKQHVHHVCSLFGVSSRMDALRRASQRGMRFD